jgi:hypothetical protein
VCITLPSFDFTVLNFIYDHCRCGILDILMPIVIRLGIGGMIWIALAMLISRSYRRVGAAMLIALVLDVTLATCF